MLRRVYFRIKKNEAAESFKLSVARKTANGLAMEDIRKWAPTINADDKPIWVADSFFEVDEVHPAKLYLIGRPGSTLELDYQYILNGNVYTESNVPPLKIRDSSADEGVSEPFPIFVKSDTERDEGE